jgi:hypothetical protein
MKQVKYTSYFLIESVGNKLPFYSLVKGMKLQLLCGWPASYALGLVRYYILLSSLSVVSYFSLSFKQ